MIPQSEIRRRARALGLQDSHVLSDYLLTHVLVAIAQNCDDLVFRGGTALARIYWPDFRLSEDLDFIAEQNVEGLSGRLQRCVDAAAQRVQRELTLRFDPPRGGRSQSVVDSELGQLLIDISSLERAHTPVERRPINAPYADLAEEPYAIRCLSLAEILANKWFMIEDRKEPRDLYDLWAGLTSFKAPFEDVLRAHTAKYGYPPARRCLESAPRLSGAWESRLANQIANLPELNKAISDIEMVFEGHTQGYSPPFPPPPL